MSKKSILALSLMVIIIVLLLIVSSKFNILNELSYYSKTNKNYIEKTYNVDVVRSTRVNKDYFFYCKDKDTSKIKYIYVEFRRDILVVDGNKGITDEEAIKISNITYDTEPYLMLWKNRNEGSDILTYLYWVIPPEGANYDSNNFINISFVDGKIKGN